MKKLLLLLMFVLPTALFSASPSCVAGMEVSIIDANGKVIKKGKLNSQGRLSLSGVDDAVWDVKLSNNGKSVELGVNNNKKRIDKSTPLLYQAKLSDYQGGDDLILRKRPGRTHSKDGGSSGLATGKRGKANLEDVNSANNAKRLDANHNTTRSNQAAALDDDSDDDGRDDDSDDAQITVTDKGNGRVEITVTILK